MLYIFSKFRSKHFMPNILFVELDVTEGGSIFTSKEMVTAWTLSSMLN